MMSTIMMIDHHDGRPLGRNPGRQKCSAEIWFCEQIWAQQILI